MTPLLEVHHLVKHFGAVRAVDDVSFTIGEGETFALVGESGCGKTTTGRCLLHLMKPTAGEIRFEGKDVSRLGGRALRQFKQRMQIVFQDPFSSLNPRFNVGRTIGEPLAIHGLCPRADIPKRVGELLETVGLRPEHAHRYPHESAQRRPASKRIGIALRSGPQSPADRGRRTGVGPGCECVQKRRSSTSWSICKSGLGVAYLFISHNLPVVRHITHRTAVMYLGRVVESGPTAQLFAEPRHPYTQALLSAVPAPDPTRRARAYSADSGEVPAVSRQIPSGCRFHIHAVRIRGDRCKQVEPALEDQGDGGQAACWLLEK